MADFLTAVKSERKKTTEQPLLTAVSTQKNPRETPDKAKKANADLITTGAPDLLPQVTDVTTPEYPLDVLRSEPDAESLIRLLKQLRSGDSFADGFNINVPGAAQAGIIHALVETTLPVFWQALSEKDKLGLLACLTNLIGLASIVAAIKRLAQKESPDSRSSSLADYLSATQSLLSGDDAVLKIWVNLSNATPEDVKQRLACKELVSLLASGKIIAAAAQAEDRLKASRESAGSSWLSHGAEYAGWLGRNIAILASCQTNSSDVDVTKSVAFAAQLLQKGLNLGYPMPLVANLTTTILGQTTDLGSSAQLLQDLLRELPTFAKRTFLEHVLQWMSTLAQDNTAQITPAGQSKDVSAISAFVLVLLEADPSVSAELLQFLGDPALASTVSFSVRRASMAALSRAVVDELETALEKMIGVFKNRTFISHAPILQQDSIAQNLLLTAGYVHRKTPMAVLMAARSANHMQGVSNRLDSSKQRARWLGMVVGTAMSSLVDKEGSKMNFGTEEVQTEEARWYLQLVKLDDSPSALAEFHKLIRAPPRPRKRRVQQAEALPVLNGKQTFGPARPPQPVQTEVVGEKVSEILDDDSDEDDDLKPYAKPDSDPEDSDEDATLVNRNKPRAPVYVRDLMRMLRDDKDHDRFQMGIKHAPALIRRKISFGGEVKDHAEELAGIFCNLQDPFDTDDFDELRLQGLIAVFLSDVQTLGPWLSRQAFGGDYSLAQRCLILSALGLAGRELAGFKDDDDLNAALPASSTSFPSKRLPGRLHAMYNPTDRSVKRLEAASQSIERQIMKPLALSAADESTAHLNAVKIRTFSSRMSTERTKRKPPPNNLAKVFGSALFFPLVSRYQQDIAAYSSGSLFASAPFLIVTYLKTLALLLHAAGPATLDLPDISTAFWDLLLSLRVQAVQDISVMEAVLFALLTLLEINSGSKERLVQENPKYLVETQQWVEVVFERAGGGELAVEGGEEEGRVRVLAAGVLVKVREVVEMYQSRLMGNLR